MTVRVCISASRCRRRPVATDRPPYFLSGGDRTGSELDPVESRLKLWRKRQPLFRTGGGLGILSHSMPEQSGKKKREKKKKKRRTRRRRDWHAARRTRGSFSPRPGILHSLRLQEPQTRASIWASASRHLSLPHPSRRLAPLVAAPPPPCSSSALLSRFASSLLLPFAITDVALSSLVSRFLFFSPKVDQTGGGRAVHCALPPYSRIPGRL